ncbi:Fc.00g023640.m01.CDS01 [Cosmosporella sp. VM-42]
MMHFVGPDNHHGYENRLTTEICPAHFSWVPPKTYDELEDEKTVAMGKVLFGVSSVETIADAQPLARSQQMDYDEDVARRASQHMFDWRRYEYWDLYTDEAIDVPLTPQIPLGQLDPHGRSAYFHYSLDKFEVADEIYRRELRGYDAMASYIGCKPGGLRQALEDAGIADDAIIIFTSDYGDMIGERGLWFKKNLFEPAVHVPLIVYRPKRRGLVRISALVSLVEILPALVEIVMGSIDVMFTDHGGSSLLPLFGMRKMLVSDACPMQFYDLSIGAYETNNLADDPARRQVAAAFVNTVHQHWDLGRLRGKVIKSQRKRQFVYRAIQKGKLFLGTLP